MKFEVVFEGRVLDSEELTPAPADKVEKQLDRILEILLGAYGVEDATYSGTLANAEIEISIRVKASDLLEAQVIGSGAIRSAIHGAGGKTAGWGIDWCAVRTSRSDEETVVKGDLVSS